VAETDSGTFTSTSIRTPTACSMTSCALLVGEARNLCVVGDEDQSIYRWPRAADVGNILRFDEDYPGARRRASRGKITARLKRFWTRPAKSSRNNKRRLGKESDIHTLDRRKFGFLRRRAIPRPKAEYAADRIRILHGDDPAVHVAVLYRTNSQSRGPLRKPCAGRGLRYRMLGGFSFYQARGKSRTLSPMPAWRFSRTIDIALLAL